MTESMSMADAPGPDRGRVTRTFLAAVAAYNVASMAIWLQPAIVSDYVVTRGFTATSAGLVASAESVTIAIVMMGASRVRRTIQFLPTMLAGLAIALVATTACIFVTSLPLLIGLRIGVAIGFAIMMLVSSMAIAGLPLPATLYGRMYTISLVCGAVVIALIPQISLFFGNSAGFKALIIYGLALLPVFLLMPASAKSIARVEDPATGRRSGTSPAIVLLASAIAVLSLAYASVWAFFLAFAKGAGLSTGQSSAAVALCMIMAMVGSMAAPVLGRAMGRDRAIMLAAALVGTFLVVVIAASGPLVFTAAGGLVLLFFYVLFPLILGASAMIDPTGRGAATVNGGMVLLSSAGPYLGGTIMTRGGASTMGVLVILCTIVSVVLFMRFGALSRRFATSSYQTFNLAHIRQSRGDPSTRPAIRCPIWLTAVRRH